MRRRYECGVVTNGSVVAAWSATASRYNTSRIERSRGGLLADATLRRLVAVCFLNQLGFQAAYFVGIIGCATYVLDAGAAEVSALVFVMNIVMLVGYSAAGALIDAVGPRIVLVASLALPLLAAPVLADAFGVQAVLVSAAALVALTGAALAAAARRVREG